MGKRRWSPVTCLLAVLTALVLSSYIALFFYHTDLINGQNKYTLHMSELAARSTRMHRVCKELLTHRQLTLPLHGRLFYISDKYNLSYCRTANVGSTFWAQVFMKLLRNRPDHILEAEVTSVFEIPRDITHTRMRKHSDLTVEFTDKRLRGTTSFLVARNPYSRLFSSYIDQIYLPNKWKQAGQMVGSTKRAASHMARDTKRPRQMARDRKRRTCGSDVTFEEFLTAISKGILSEKETDLHWAPIYSICLPCETNIDILAKHEHFLQDTDEILKYVGVENSLIDKVKQSSKDSVSMYNIQILLHTYMDIGRQVPRGCISEAQLARKVLTTFQIKGYIHNEHKFPSNLFKSVHQNNTETVLLNELMTAAKKRKITASERDEQRKTWQSRFWKNISIETLKLVQDAFYEDFVVFDYDTDIKKI